MPERRFFPPGYTPLLDDGFDDLGAPVDVVEQLQTHDTVAGRSLGEVSDTVRFVGEPIIGIGMSVRWGNEPWRSGAYDPYYDDRNKPADPESPRPKKDWATPTIVLARHLQWDVCNGHVRVWSHRWSTPYLEEDKSFVAMRVVRWVSRTTGEECTTLASERMGAPWVATNEWTHYEQYGAGLARFVVPPP